MGKELAFGERTGISRDVYIAPSKKAAREAAGKAVMGALNFSNWRGPRIYLKPGESFAPGQEEALRKELPFEFVDERSLIFGPPEYAIDKLLELEESLNIEQVNIKCGWPGMTQRQIMQSLVPFAEKVLPALKSNRSISHASNA